MDDKDCLPYSLNIHCDHVLTNITSLVQFFYLSSLLTFIPERSGRLPVSGSHVIPWSTVPDHNDVLYTNYDGSDG